MALSFFFTKQAGEENSYDIKGKGTNQYGVFSISGTAVKHNDKEYGVEFRKKYISTPDASRSAPISGTKKSKSKSKKRKLTSSTPISVEKNEEPLPDPSESFPHGVVCLQGKATRDSSVQDGVVHKIKGLWSTGLDLVQSDPKNENGFCNEFEYEHKSSSVGTDIFPISGRYTGWFNFTEDGSTKPYTEKDVVLKFKKNNGGFYNVEGKGTNMFGKYTISGTLNKDNGITLFRHFMPVKSKKAVAPSAAYGSSKIGGRSLTLDDVDVPKEEFYKPIEAPADGLYQALSRGSFKVNEDGFHTCTGKWAASRSLHAANNSSNFNFGLEEHHAKQAIEDMKRKGLIDDKDANNVKLFPVDSANYKGSFKMKKGTAPIIDQQIAMKFRKNTQGSYNVYGKGVNKYGHYDLVGTLVTMGPSGGNVELFKIYTPEMPLAPAQAHSKGKSLPLAKNAPTKKNLEKLKPQPDLSAQTPNLIRRESSRQVKLPSHLVDDDPEANKARMMDKCSVILAFIKEKDVKGGAYFLEPVDPVAHGIPTYHQIITNPMDLGTIQAKMDANEIESPEEFARLVKLVFENALKFNSNPMNFVHQNARELLSIFNQKFRDVERLMKKPTKTELKEIRKKQQREEKKRFEKEKKRKREEDEDPKAKQLSLLQASSEDVARSLEALDSVTSAGDAQSLTVVSRDEFNSMTLVLKQMQAQMTCIQALLHEFVTPDKTTSTTTSAPSTVSSGESEGNPAKKPRKTKKPPKAQPKAPTVPEPEIPVAPAPAPKPASPPVVVPPVEEEPLTHEEQEELTIAINEMSEDKITDVIEIIKKSKQASDLIDDDQEIELELDQLDSATQRKLLKFALKNKPKPKRKRNRKPPKDASPPPEPVEPEPNVNEPVRNTAPDESAFNFGENSDTDDESDDDNEPPTESNENANNSGGFHISENNLMEGEDDDSDDDNDAAPDWTNLSKPTKEAASEDEDSGDEDDAWAAARGAVAAQTELDKERQEREERMVMEQRLAKEKSLAEAAEKKRKIDKERQEREEEEGRRREQKDKEEKERARKAKDEIMKEIDNTESTVDLDKQNRILGGIMNEYEQSIIDNDVAGGASPSSDFGF